MGQNTAVTTRDRMDVLREIVDTKSLNGIRFAPGRGGHLMVDLFTASAMLQVYEAINDDNKVKFARLVNGTKAQFIAMANFSLKQIG